MSRTTLRYATSFPIETALRQSRLNAEVILTFSDFNLVFVAPMVNDRKYSLSTTTHRALVSAQLWPGISPSGRIFSISPKVNPAVSTNRAGRCG